MPAPLTGDGDRRVRHGVSMRDVESVCEKAGLGKLSKSTAQRICTELRERFEQFKRRDHYDIRLVALFLDATLLAVRPQGPKEGVRIAWWFTEDGERVLLSVTLGMREFYDDWQALARDVIARGLGAPMLVVADGAPGLIKAIERRWPASDRQRCCVHRARNLYAKVPERGRERVRKAYWRVLDEAINERDAKHQLQGARRPTRQDRVHRRGQMPRRRSRCPRHPSALPHQTPPAMAIDKPARALTRRGQTPHQGDRPVPGRGPLPHPRLGRPRPRHHQRANGIRFTQLDRRHLNRVKHADPEQTIPQEVNAAYSDHHREPRPRRIYTAKATPPPQSAS
jgi:hypothetical protein